MPTRDVSSKSLRIEYPGTQTLSLVPDRSWDRDLGDPGRTAVIAALTDAGMEPVQEFRLTPKAPTRSPAPTRATPAPERRTVTLEVASDESAVILVDRDGCYSWHLPTEDATRAPLPARPTRDLPGATRTLSFDLTPAGTATRDLEVTRGLFGGLLPGALRAVVMKFAAPWLAGQAIGFLERDVQRGLIVITDSDPQTWRRVEDLASVRLPSDRTPRILLLVHGTFSSTAATYGALGCTAEGCAFLTAALSSYDAVLGFDHPTLSVDPLANATDLLRRLEVHQAPMVIDVLCHSRGGLVSRSFAEQVLPASGWAGSVDRIVFTAAPNGGTSLADPKRWNDLLEVITNLTAVGAAVVAGLPGGAPVSTVVAGAIKGIAALVKYLGAYALTQGGVPGLASMTPDGPFVTDLNAFQPGQPREGTNWFVVSSDFHVNLFDDHHNPPEFPRELARRLAEGAVDPIFQGANDLVVNDSSMAEIGGPGGGFVADTLDFGTNDVVYHGNYFLQPAFFRTVTHWLLDRPSASRAEPPTSGRGATAGISLDDYLTGAEPPFPEEVGQSEFEYRDLGGPAVLGGAGMDGPEQGGGGSVRTVRRTRSLGDRGGLEVAAREPEARSRPDPGPAEPVPAHLLAEMPSAPVVGERSEVRVALSRRRIEARTVNGTHDDATIPVLPGRELTAHVVGKLNAVVDGCSTDVFTLPAGNGISELTFRVIPQQVGAVVVSVDIRDGVVPLAMLTLKADAVATGSGPVSATYTARTTTASTDTPDLEDTFWLEIHETEIGDRTVFEYTVRSPSLGLLETYTSPPLRDRQRYVSELFRDIACLYDDHGPGAAFVSGLQDRGAQLFDELFPRELRELLWQYRTHLDNFLLLADEPFIPWELVHLKAPSGRRGRTPMFLGQLGLVRWQFAGFPRRTLRARTGRVWSLCPAYPDSPSVLVESQAEAEYLAQHFSAHAAVGTEAGLTSLLHRGRFDLLHFSGHGFTDPADVQSAKIVLAGEVGAGGTVAPRYLTATTVAQNAHLRAADGGGPLIVVNACQTGRGGEQLSSFGGFAKAFLDAGAAAYVSTLWSVREVPAREFVETLYDRLVAGDTMAVATRAAREAARGAGDASWLAYVVYARPDARLVTT